MKLLILLLLLLLLFKNNREGFGGMMQAVTKTGANISVPALCSSRGIDYCQTTKGCIWNKNKCELQKGWTTGAIGRTPLYVPRRCKDRRLTFQCETTDGCQNVQGKCQIKHGYREVKNQDGEILYVPSSCSDRTIQECGSGKECLWVQGKCMRRDANQKHTKLHSRKKVCSINHKGIGFGKSIFICSDKPMPLAPSKMKTGIPETPPSQKKNVPTLMQTLSCFPGQTCQQRHPTLLQDMSPQDTKKFQKSECILKEKKKLQHLQEENEQCDRFCGKTYKCADIKESGERCNLLTLNSKLKCEEAFDGGVCQWKNIGWKPCTKQCREMKCANCKNVTKKVASPWLGKSTKKKVKQIMDLHPFYQAHKSPNQTIKEVHIDLNYPLTTFNQRDYDI